MSFTRLRVGLEPNHAERSGQPQQGAKLKLPLPNDEAFLWEKCQRQQRSENDGSPRKNRINARAHVEKSHHLGDLMNDIRQARQETKPNRTHVDPRPATAHPIKHQRRDGDAGH